MRKKIALSVLLVGILFFCGFRVVTVNSQVENIKVKKYQMGEEVKMGNDILFYGSMKGYSLTVDSAKVLNYEEFSEVYGGNLEDINYSKADKLYDVCITLKNSGAAGDTGINFSNLYIQNSDVLASIDTFAYDLANPELAGNYAVCIRNNTEMQFHLPFHLIKGYFTEKNWDNIEKYNLNLVVTLFPTKKVVSLVE